MKQMKIIALLLGLCVCLASCNSWNNMSKTGQGAIIGTGGGAALGTAIGAIAGNTALGAVIGAAVGAGTGAIIGKKMDKTRKEAEAIKNAQVETVKDANNLDDVKVTFNSGILFDTGKSTLSSTAKNSLAELATVMKNNADCDIAIQGYTDNQGWKKSTAEQSAQKNLNLSQQRAESVKNYLTSQGVSYNQFKNVTGYGEQNPVADNSTKAGQQANRRVEVYLYASEKMIEKANNGQLN